MSFLNTLASDGLSVGLRIYNDRLNSQSSRRAFGPEAEEPAELISRRLESEESACPKTAPKIETKTETPEEMAAGRREAQAMLAGDAAVGRLQATEAENSRAGESSSGQIGEKKDEEEEGADQAANGAPASPGQQLSEEERQQVQDMKKRDQEVRTHEQAHVAAAAGLAGAPVYEYQTGPDGRRYAVGGHVNLRTSGSSDPEQAIREAEAVKRAANAPANPSSTDRAAAAQASADINRLKAEKSAGRASGEDDETGLNNDQGHYLKARAEDEERAGQALNGSSAQQQALGAYGAVKLGTTAAGGGGTFFNRVF